MAMYRCVTVVSREDGCVLGACSHVCVTGEGQEKNIVDVYTHHALGTQGVQQRGMPGVAWRGTAAYTHRGTPWYADGRGGFYGAPSAGGTQRGYVGSRCFF